MNRIKLAFITCLMMLSFPLFAQKVTLNERNSKLKDVLEKIVEQTNYDLFYSTEILKKSKRVRIKATDKDLKLVLDEIFQSQTISYSIAYKTIVLVPKRPQRYETVIEVNLDQLTFRKEKPIIEGNIIDQKGDPIRGVTIINNKDPKKYRSISDIDGNFSIDASRGDLLSFSSQGFKETTFLFKGERFMNVTLYNQVLEVSEITVEARVKKKLNLNTQIDLTNRSYMNLGQVLQGTVPGLTLQILPSNKKKILGITKIDRDPFGSGYTNTYFTLDQFLQKYNPNGQRMIDAIERKTILPGGGDPNVFFIEYSNQASVTLVPELRGSATFGNTEGMMIIIDGFPVEDFPADYPMANVESVEVIKDPKELIKWGPRATAGIIMLKTKTGTKNKISISYNTNMYFKPAPKYNMNKLGIATSEDIIDFLKSAVDSNFIFGNGDSENINMAERLVYWHKDNKITTAEYNRRMDSLSMLSNQDQVALLQQNVFSQNHLLTLSGGTKEYLFRVTGSYSNYKSNGLNNNSNTYGVDVKNMFNLLGGKLRADWQINANRTDAQGGANDLSIYNLPPAYQMFLDHKGNYVYDQRVLGEYNNNIIMRNGYFNHGSNFLEDARLMNNISNNTELQSRLNMNWDIFKGLRWDNALFYRRRGNNSERITDRNSSEARQIFNNYGSPTASGVDFYIPPGDIYNRIQNIDLQWNLRSALSYALNVDDHTVTATIGGGGANEMRQRPAFLTRYGYNKVTGQSSAIFLPAGASTNGITNFRSLYSTSAALNFPYTLLPPNFGDTSINRNINWNAGLEYSFKERTLFFSANYTEAFSPNYGMDKYATTRSYSGSIGYQFKNKILPSWLNGVMVSTGIDGNNMPNLPTTIGSNRYIQPEWNNYAIWVNNFIPVQQAGQSSRNIYQELRMNMFDGTLSVHGRYNTQRMNGISSNGSLTDSAAFNQRRTLGYFSAGAEGSLRDGTLMFNGEFNRSPEGQKQFNGNISYDIKKESFFTSEFISSLLIGASYQDMSSLQGLGLMMGTNSTQGGGFGLATNNSFSVLPPRNRNIEVYLQTGFDNDRHRIDLRYYNRSDRGISNNIPLPTDPSTGLQNQLTMSNMVNKGLEFFFKSDLVRKTKLTYSISINGAYNINMAKEVPKTPYSARSSYLNAFRDGYSTTSVWAYRWAGLDGHGAPQIYDAKGNITSNPDSTVLANDIVYMGATRAPWTGGFMHDFSYGNVFARISIMGSFGGIMRKYIPISSAGSYENLHAISQRWRKPGDEAFTDIPALTRDANNSIQGFIAQNSTNSFMSADFIRLQEVMFGWQIPKEIFNDRYIKSATISAHMQNIAVWAKNKFNYDPNNVDGSGRLGLPTPIQFGATLNVVF